MDPRSVCLVPGGRIWAVKSRAGAYPGGWHRGGVRPGLACTSRRRVARPPAGHRAATSRKGLARLDTQAAAKWATCRAVADRSEFYTSHVAVMCNALGNRPQDPCGRSALHRALRSYQRPENNDSDNRQSGTRLRLEAQLMSPHPCALRRRSRIPDATVQARAVFASLRNAWPSRRARGTPAPCPARATAGLSRTACAAGLLRHAAGLRVKRDGRARLGR